MGSKGRHLKKSTKPCWPIKSKESCAYKSKNWSRPLFRPRPDHACPQRPNPSRETVPLSTGNVPICKHFQRENYYDQEHIIWHGSTFLKTTPTPFVSCWSILIFFIINPLCQSIYSFFVQLPCFPHPLYHTVTLFSLRMPIRIRLPILMPFRLRFLPMNWEMKSKMAYTQNKGTKYFMLKVSSGTESKSWTSRWNMMHFFHKKFSFYSCYFYILVA